MPNRNNNIRQNEAKLKTKCNLGPYESKTVTLTLDAIVKSGDDVVLTSNLNNPNLKLESTDLTVTPHKTTDVIITNLSGNRITLNKQMNIATIAKQNSKERDMEQIKKIRREELREDDFNLTHLDQNSKTQLLKLLMEFGDIFSKRIFTIGKTDMVTPKLQIDTDNLPSIRPYSVPTSLRSELKRQLDELESANLIEKNNSHISSPLIMVRKKNESGDPTKQTWRLVSDYRKANLAIKYNRYPLPLVNTLLDNLRGSSLYCNLDLSSSFWQCALPEEYRDVTSFNTIYGTYRYRVLPQGLNFSPGVMQQIADQLLAPISDLNISNYIDDFCLGADNINSMLLKLRKLFMQLRKYGLTLNPQKCIFMVPETKFLGHKLNGNGITPTDENLRKINDFPIPSTTRKTRRWVGLVSYYRRFIPNFSEICAPLTDLTKKKKKFIWTNVAQIAFDTLKDLMSKSPILIHPDYSKQFILSTDASDLAVASMLGQRDEYGIIHPISYFSKKLNNTQTRYPIMEKELYAIVESLKCFKTYLYGREFVIRCDNSALQTIRKLESPANRVARWILFISEYQFTFELIHSQDNVSADIFSRDYHTINSLPISIPDIMQIKKEQYSDPTLSKLIDKLINKSAVLSPSEEKYFLRDGLLMHSSYQHRASNSGYIDQIVIPDKYKPNILTMGHAAHFSHKKTYLNIREHYFWKNLYEDSKHFVNSCKECFAFKSPKRYAPVPLQRHFIPTRPLQYVSADLTGKHSTTSNGNKYILTIVDHFTKYLKTYALKEQTAIATAEKLYQYICTFGAPEYLLTDLGRNFTSQLFKEVSKKLGVAKLFTSPGHPQSNGNNESLHRALKKSISILARENSEWDEVLPLYEMYYNGTYHSTINEKPSYLLLGYDISLPTGMLDPNHKPNYDSIPDFIEKKTDMLNKAYKNVHDNILQAAVAQEKYQSRFSKPRYFQPGELAFIYNPQVDRNVTVPKRRNYTGPVRIEQRHNPVNYTVSDPNNPHKRPQKVHTDRLIHYTPRRSHLEYRAENIIPPTDTQILPESENKPPPRFSDNNDSDDDDDDDIPLIYFTTKYNGSQIAPKVSSTTITQLQTPQRPPILPTPTFEQNPQTLSPPQLSSTGSSPSTIIYEYDSPLHKAAEHASTRDAERNRSPPFYTSEEEENVPISQLKRFYDETQHKAPHAPTTVRSPLLPTPPLLPIPVLQSPHQNTLPSGSQITGTEQSQVAAHTIQKQRKRRTPIDTRSYELRNRTNTQQQNIVDRFFNWALRMTEDDPPPEEHKSREESD